MPLFPKLQLLQMFLITLSFKIISFFINVIYYVCKIFNFKTNLIPRNIYSHLKNQTNNNFIFSFLAFQCFQWPKPPTTLNSNRFTISVGLIKNQTQLNHCTKNRWMTTNIKHLEAGKDLNEPNSSDWMTKTSKKCWEDNKISQKIIYIIIYCNFVTF